MIDKLLTFYKTGIVNKSVKVLFIRMAGVIFFFALTLFLTNFFSADLVGKYDFSRSFLILFGGLAVLGMNQSILYFSGFLSSKEALNSIKKIYYKMLTIVLILAIVFIGLLLLINKDFINAAFEKDVYDLIFKSILVLFFYAVTTLNIDVFRAINKIYVSELFRNIFRYLPFFVLAIVVYSLDRNERLIDVFLLSFIITGVVSTTYLLIHFKYKSIPNQDNKIVVSYKEIIKRSSPMAISTMAFILMQSVDIILIGKFLDFDAVAYYAVTVKLTMAISLVLASVNIVNAPIIANLYALEDKPGLKKNLKKAARLIFVFTIPAIIILALLSNPVLGFFGEDYKVAQKTLFILLIGQSVNALCGSVGVYMNMTGKQIVLQNLLLIAFAINLALNWMLIPVYGIEGAAMATTISMMFWNLIGAFYLYKKDGIKTFVN